MTPRDPSQSSVPQSNSAPSAPPSSGRASRIRRAVLPTLMLVAAVAALLLVLPSPDGAHSAGAPTANPDDPSSVITAETVFNRLYFLASDGLRGRDTPSPGLDAAAAWLVSEHRRMGLEPAGEDDTFYQRWPFRQIAPDVENATVALTGSGGTTPVLFAENGSLRGASDAPLDGDLVFVGDPWGAPPAAGSLDGQVMVVHLPGEITQPWRQRANQAAARAQEAGATASVVLVDPAMDAGTLEEFARLMANPTWRMGMDYLPPQVFLTPAAAITAVPELGELLSLTGEDVREPISGARLEGSLPADVRVDGRPANVVAMIPGSDPELRNEYVVLSAHYDHVGVGTPMDGDSIYNGADDNGSGTVALLETARAIQGMSEAPRRSVLFVHVSGEEKGLLGASWFVDHPTVPEEAMIANINADMIGGDHHQDSLIVIGKTYSTLGPLVDRVNEGLPELNLITSDDLWPEQRFFFRSDQFHFMRKEIPSLFFFTGVHECYHRPCDTVERVSHDKIARVSRLLVHSVLEIANADERPEWDPAGLAEVRELTGGGR